MALSKNDMIHSREDYDNLCRIFGLKSFEEQEKGN